MIDRSADQGVRVLGWLTAALLLTLPFAHTVALRHLLTALVLLTLAWRHLGVARTVPRAVNLALLCWLAFSAASITWSVNPTISTKAWLNDALYPAIVFYGLYVTASVAQRQYHIQIAVVLGIVALALLSAFGYETISVDALRPGLPYYYPGVGQASSYAVFALPASALIVQIGRWKVLGVIGLVASVIIGIASLNRMFWPTAVLTLLCALGFRYRSSTYKMMFGASAMAAAIVAIGLIYQVRIGSPDTKDHPDVAASVQSMRQMLISDPRREIWRSFSYAVLDAPWIGMGFGKTVPHLYYRAHHPQNPILSGDKAWEHAHNIFLNTALQTGLVGLVAFLWLLGVLAWSFAGARAHSSAAAWAGLALLLALVLKNLTDDFMRDSMAMYFWALAGWLLAIATRNDDSRSPPCSR